MDLSDNTVLVTGGGSGIGLAIAKRFLDAGSQVIICGRRADKLAEARATYPRLETRVADIANATGREELIAWMIAEYPDFNVIVNSAGIQRRERFATDTADWSSRQQEIATNLEAPIADLRDPESLRTAAGGVDGVFHINPALAPDEAEMGVAMVEAAKVADVRKFVFSGEAGELTFDEWVQTAHIPDGPTREDFRQLYAYYNQYDFPGGNALILRAILGREPRTMPQYIQELARKAAALGSKK